MTKHYTYIYLIFSALLCCAPAFSQDYKKGVGTEVVNVVKQYNPTISDADKIKETPQMVDYSKDKEEVKYNVLSFPVASTFVPLKASAKEVEKTEKEKLYKNYASLGAGNFFDVNAELYMVKELKKDDTFGLMAQHYSSQGGIKDIPLDNFYSHTLLDLAYKKNKKDFFWDLGLMYKNSISNWYGIPNDLWIKFPTEDRDEMLSTITPKIIYNTVGFMAGVDYNKYFLDKVDFKFYNFTDERKSKENNIYFKTSFFRSAGKGAVKTDFTVNSLSGSFQRGYDFTDPITYKFTNIGLSPYYEIENNQWKLMLGLNAVYGAATLSKDDNFYFYPRIYTHYSLVDEFMILYAGLLGDLQQNSFRELTNANTYLSPTLNIKPTDKQYDFFVGLKGKIVENVSYDLDISYKQESSKALFKANDYDQDPVNKDYAYGNSFKVIYDNVATTSAFGEMKTVFFNIFHFDISGSYSIYKMSKEKEAWNLPSFRVNSTIALDLTPKTRVGLNVFYVGTRKDMQQEIAANYPKPPIPVTLDAYLDMNANINYKLSEKWSAFLRFNNILDKSYQKWLNYNVQDFQIMAGLNCKFDFK